MSVLENEQLEKLINMTPETTEKTLQDFLVFIKGNDTFAMYRGWYMELIARVKGHDELQQECIKYMI
tara:strand:+ start:3694 stop:3894 length:201 start_codon:yes stop_codon:yes gene_type:complete